MNGESLNEEVHVSRSLPLINLSLLITDILFHPFTLLYLSECLFFKTLSIQSPGNDASCDLCFTILCVFSAGGGLALGDCHILLQI